MHSIIETKDQLTRLQEHCTDSCFIQVIPNNDNFHPKLTNISCIYYRCLNSKDKLFTEGIRTFKKCNKIATFVVNNKR